MRLWILALFNNDFKGASECPGRANGFAGGAPMTVFSLNNSNNIIDHSNSATATDTDAKLALITFSLIN